MELEPPPERGRALLMVLLLCLVVALFVGWAYLRHPLGSNAGTSAPTPKAGTMP
jgi:hypothetical protein